jgi:ATP-dependent exoDNAse (exonuclease V) beta subunit
VSAVIDRCFEDDDGTLWVVDYKTAAQAVGDDRIETYVAKGIERYRDQLAVYARLLAEVRGGGRIRTALYFADADRLEEIETDA